MNPHVVVQSSDGWLFVIFLKGLLVVRSSFLGSVSAAIIALAQFTQKTSRPDIDEDASVAHCVHCFSLVAHSKRAHSHIALSGRLGPENRSSCQNK